MIVIVNVTPDAPLKGLNKYEVRINQRVIAEFEHLRGEKGLSRRLRDAADAVDKAERDKWESMVTFLFGEDAK